MPHRRRLAIAWDEYADRLGRVSDVELAAEVGCSPTAVYKARQDRGIGPFVPARVQLEHLVNRFGRVLRTTTVAVAFASPRCARRWLVEGSRLLGRGATRDRRWLALPKGLDADELAALPDELLDVLEGAMAAERDRDLLVAGLKVLAHEAVAVRVVAAGVDPAVVDGMPADLVELLDTVLTAARERDALVAGIGQIGASADDVRSEGRAALGQ